VVRAEDSGARSVCSQSAHVRFRSRAAASLEMLWAKANSSAASSTDFPARSKRQAEAAVGLRIYRLGNSGLARTQASANGNSQKHSVPVNRKTLRTAAARYCCGLRAGRLPPTPLPVCAALAFTASKVNGAAYAAYLPSFWTALRRPSNPDCSDGLLFGAFISVLIYSPFNFFRL